MVYNWAASKPELTGGCFIMVMNIFYDSYMKKKVVRANYHFFEPVVWLLQVLIETWVVGTYLSPTLMRLPTLPGHMPRAAPNWYRTIVGVMHGCFRAKVGLGPGPGEDSARSRYLPIQYLFGNSAWNPSLFRDLQKYICFSLRILRRVLEINSEADLWHIFPRKLCN